LLSLDHISVQFGGRLLFKDLSCVVSPHDRIGLVGANGTGKTTLLRIICGRMPPDSGTLSKAKYVTVGYLPQEGVAAAGKSLFDEAASAFEDLLEVQRELEEAQANLASLNPESPDYGETLEIFGELQHKLEDLDAFRMRSQVERVLMGLGFAVDDFERRTEEFSGGWQMRIELAKLLLRQPSLLLLDEPTNHLDLESLQWLEEYLRNYHGAVILVSHDRAFLDNLCSKTFALSLGRMDSYAGNYSFFEREREQRRELRLSAYKNQQEQIKHTQQFIERFRYKATKASQVQSRIKQLEKMELIEIEPKEEAIRFEFPPAQPSGRIVIELKGVSKSYGEKRIFEGLDYKIERGDRLAVVGVNGAGKSTLSRMLAGIEPFDGGDRVIGRNVTLSYFGQHQAEELDLSKDVLGIVDEVAQGEIRKRLRTILGAFLFHGDDVFKRVEVLSGGEKSRLALAKMLLQPANFLIMDEPTNHLDMRSKMVLQDALSGYEGTFLIVSHDRAFLDPIVNKVLEVQRGAVKTYLGNVSDYIVKKREEREAPGPPTGTVAKTTDSSRSSTERERKRLEAEKRQELYRKLKPLNEKVQVLERQIELLETRKKEIEELMGNPSLYKDGAEAKRTSQEHKEVQQLLEEAYYGWGTLQDEIERVREDGTGHPATK
jgi:ATP-binding cassette subfamily F protein 3